MPTQPRTKPEFTQLRAAREALGLSIAEAARVLDVRTDQLRAWENGESEPDGDQLWHIANAYGRSIGYFFALPSRGPERQDYRLSRVRRVPSDAQIRRFAVAEFEELCRARMVLGSRRGEERPALAVSIRDRSRGEEDPETLARAVRGLAKLAGKPIEDIRALMESWGIAVFLANLPKGSSRENLSGTSWWHPEFGPAMLINRGDAPGRRTFTIAHELAHLLRLNVQPLCDLNDASGEEKYANAFASAFLMPESDLKRVAAEMQRIGELSGWDTTRAAIAKIAHRYGTGVQATSIRLENLGVLPRGYSELHAPELSKEFVRASRGRRWRKAVRDLGSEYLRSVRIAYERRELSIAAVAGLLKIEVDEAMEWLEDGE